MSSPKKHPITQDEIARITGVSQAAVSAILGSSEASKRVAVSEETRMRVLSAAAENGYRARKKQPRSEPVGKTRTVLMVGGKYPTGTDVPWMEEAMTAVFAKMTRTCVERLAKSNTRMILLSEDPYQVVHRLKDSDIDGVLWHISDADPAPLQWVASRYPLVLLNRVWDGNADYDIASLNQEKAQLLALEHLWERGHRRIAMFGHWKGNSFFRRRVAAYKQFTQEKNLRDYVEFQQIDDTPQIPAMQKVEAMLRLWRDMDTEAPTALIAPDVFTLPLMKLASHYNVRVPEDLSLVAMDNSLPCQAMEPMVTSVDFPFDEIASVAVDMLLQRMDKPGQLSRTVQITPRLIARNSVKNLLLGITEPSASEVTTA